MNIPSTPTPTAAQSEELAARRAALTMLTQQGPTWEERLVGAGG